MRTELKRHPGQTRSPAASVEVDISRTSPAVLSLHYRLVGDLNRLRIPEAATPVQADELWKQTCFELFLRPDASGRYFEFNLSPSRRWSGYRFSDYREGMQPVDLPSPRINRAAPTSDAFDLDATLDLRNVPDLPADRPWRAAVSAVIEAADGSKSFWALAHPPGEPDFHHIDSFTLALAPPEAP